jgi:phage gp16-like protein
MPIMDKAAAIKLVHVARRDLAIPDDEWRALLQTKFHVESSKDLDISGLYRLVEHLKKCGFKVRHKVGKAGRAAPSSGASRPLAGAARARPDEAAKIRALWLFLHTDLGLVNDPSERALSAYLKRITGVEALQWLDPQKTYQVIETLKKWAERVFYDKLICRADALMPLVISRSGVVSEAGELLQRASESRTKSGKPGAYDACLAAWRMLDVMEKTVGGGDCP